MQNEQLLQKNPFPVMISVAGGRAINVDHFLQIETQALESHRTILVHTTTGAYMFHDDVAMDLVVAFGLRKAAEPEPVKGKRGK